MAAPRKHPPANAVSEIERLAAAGHSIIGVARQLGVTKGTFKRWCDEDESIQEAFEVGRDTHRQYLVSLIVEAAKVNKGANANAMFLLKTMHGFREFDSPNTKVDVNLNAPTNVLVVKDLGTNEEWAAKAAAQQRALTADCTSAPLPLEAPQPARVDLHPSFAPPAYLAPILAPSAPTQAPQAPQFEIPVWRGRA
jgi:hypothetical protein